VTLIDLGSSGKVSTLAILNFTERYNSPLEVLKYKLSTLFKLHFASAKPPRAGQCIASNPTKSSTTHDGATTAMLPVAVQWTRRRTINKALVQANGEWVDLTLTNFCAAKWFDCSATVGTRRVRSKRRVNQPNKPLPKTAHEDTAAATVPCSANV
jgi:hypothetical protein